MVWTRHRQEQQRGAQLHARSGARSRPAGEAPEEATEGREVQDHDYADLQVSDGEPQRGIDYPATNPPDRKGDITPSAPTPSGSWDDVVQPERKPRDRGEPDDDLPLPEGK